MHDNQISIIIQGPFIVTSGFNAYATMDVLKSARVVYPGAEIIYSGWEGTILPQEFVDECDKLILSSDPGPLLIGYNAGIPLYENTNRQIVSVQNGLKACSREFCIKTRSDTKFVERILFESLECHVIKPFTSCIIIPETFSRFYFFEYGGIRPCIGHVSDLVHVGFKKDLEKYWCGPLIPPFSGNYDKVDLRPTAEQLLFLRFLMNNEIIKDTCRINSKFQDSFQDLSFDEYRYMISRIFKIKSESDLGIALPTRFRRTLFEKLAFINQGILDEVMLKRKFRILTLRRISIAYTAFLCKNILSKMIGLKNYKKFYYFLNKIE